MAKLVRALVVFALVFLADRGVAQDGAGNTFETSPWALLLDNKWPGRPSPLNYRVRQGLHRNTDRSYRQHLLDHLYEGMIAKKENTDGGAVLNCKGEDGGVVRLSQRAANDLLIAAAAAAEWHRDRGFPSVGNRFSAVPTIVEKVTVDADGNEIRDLKLDASRYVNLIVCDAKDDAKDDIASIAWFESTAAVNLFAIESAFPQTAESRPALSHTVAHEIAHVYQHVLMPVWNDDLDQGPALDSLTEAFAEATGNLFTFDQLAGHNGTIARDDVTYSNVDTKTMFMARAYNVPLLLSEKQNEDLARSVEVSTPEGRELLRSVDNWMKSTFSYETAGFYFHIVERYLDYNPAGIVPLYKAITKPASHNLYPALNTFLDTIDGGVSKGLEHVLPQFLAEYADWGTKPRTQDKDLGATAWMNATFGGCDELMLDTENVYDWLEFNIAKFAGACVNLYLRGDLVTRLPEIEMFLSSEDGDVREVYAGIVKILGVDGEDFSCFDWVEENGVEGVPCLLDPIDGSFFADLFSTRLDPVARHFYVGPICNSTGDTIRVRLIFTHVPQDLASQNSFNADAAKYRLNVAVDSTQLLGDGVEPASAESTQDGAAAFTCRGPGRMFGQGRLGTTRDAGSVSEMSMYEEMLAGGFAIPGISVMQTGGVGAGFFGFEAQSAHGDFGIFLNPEVVPEYGEIGRFNLYPLGGGHFAGDGEETAIFDPNRGSYVDIFENTPESLVYFGEVHVCSFSQAELMAEIASNRGRHPCEFGRPRTYFLESSVAFPELVPVGGRRGGAPAFQPLPPTPAYEKYKNLRLSRLGMQLGNYPDPADSVSPSIGDPRPDPAVDVLEAGGRGSGEDPKKTCDCTCDGKQEFDRLFNLGAVEREQKACRLLCGRRWQACEG